MKKKWSADRIFMLVMGMLMQAVFLFPWIRISGHGYNAPSYLIHVIAGGGKASLFQKDLCSFSMLNGLAWKELQPIAIVFVVQMLLLTAAQGCCLVHMIMVIRKNKNRQVLYYIAGIAATCTAFLYSQGPILATGDLLTEGYTFVVMCCIGIEIVGVCMIESWEDFSADYNQSKQRDAEAKKEKKERTQFEGKYSNLFLKTIWENFRYNWHSYRIFVLVSTFSVSLIFAGFGMWEILKSAHAHENLLMGQGLGTILLGFLAAIIVTAVFLIISVLLFYLKNHVKNYGIFVTLGMRKRTLYRFMGIELVSCMLISLILGIVFGNVLVFICRAAIGNMPGVNLVMGNITYVSFVLTIVCTFAIFLLSVLLSREVYIDTGASVSGNKAVEREKMPGRWAKYGLIPGALLFAYGLLEFASRGAFEGIRTLIIFFIGVYLLMRNGLVLYLRNRNERAYYGSLLRNNHFYYRYRTTFRYLFFFTVIHVCVLFVFAKGMISSVIADRPDQQFPYDYVCMATEDDDGIFEEIAEDYDADITIYPMVRVINVDNTTKSDNYMSSMFPQGQQIGISESTYRDLCQMRGWECDELNLADDGSEIAVIYQQDQSVNAHPLDYYLRGRKPYLHIGQPIQYYEFVDREEIFPPRKIKDSRTGSLIGSFRQGRHENIVVFSDEYFEKVKDDWKKTDCVTGMALEGEAITDVTVHQWPTQLVLINVPEENRESVEKDLDQFNRNHAYDNHIDSSVLSYYSKADLTDERSTEKFMHIAVNGFIMVILSIVSLVLMYLKMESEMDEKRRQYDFLKCMGMKRADRIRLMRKEREDFLVIPVILATVISIVFTLIIWRLRQYTSEDCISYLKVLAGVYVIYIVVQVIGTKCFEWFCIKKIEG